MDAPSLEIQFLNVKLNMNCELNPLVVAVIVLAVVAVVHLKYHWFGLVLRIRIPPLIKIVGLIPSMTAVVVGSGSSGSDEISLVWS